MQLPELEYHVETNFCNSFCPMLQLNGLKMGLMVMTYIQCVERLLNVEWDGDIKPNLLSQR